MASHKENSGFGSLVVILLWGIAVFLVGVLGKVIWSLIEVS